MAQNTVVCPACGKDVKVVDDTLALHERTPDPIGDVEQDSERCRWSNEPVALIVD